MDTSSHVCMGLATGLMVANIATNNGYDVDTQSVVTMSIIANVFPDIDVLFKLKSNNAYINNHRGMSHSFLFALIWIALLTLISFTFFKENLFTYFICITLGLSLHIFTDLLNGYGVQFFWPIHKKWIALGITYTFDAVLIILHLFSFLLIFLLKLPVLPVFIATYVLILIYILVSFIMHYFLKQALIKKYGRFKRVILQAKATPFRWKFVYETQDKKFFMGIVKGKTIVQLRYEKRQEVLEPELEAMLMKDKDVKSFIDFTPIFNYHIHKRQNGIIEIKFYDLRYLMVRKNQQSFTFNCIVLIKDNKVLTSYLGFTINEENADKKFEKLKHKNAY